MSRQFQGGGPGCRGEDEGLTRLVCLWRQLGGDVHTQTGVSSAMRLPDGRLLVLVGQALWGAAHAGPGLGVGGGQIAPVGVVVWDPRPAPGQALPGQPQVVPLPGADAALLLLAAPEIAERLAQEDPDAGQRRAWPETGPGGPDHHDPARP